MTDRLKTVYPPKTSFCGGYNELNGSNLRSSPSACHILSITWSSCRVSMSCRRSGRKHITDSYRQFTGISQNTKAVQVNLIITLSLRSMETDLVISETVL